MVSLDFENVTLTELELHGICALEGWLKRFSVNLLLILTSGERQSQFKIMILGKKNVAWYSLIWHFITQCSCTCLLIISILNTARLLKIYSNTHYTLKWIIWYNFTIFCIEYKQWDLKANSLYMLYIHHLF